MITDLVRGTTKNWGIVQHKQYQSLIGKYARIGIEVEASLTNKGFKFLAKLPPNTKGIGQEWLEFEDVGEDIIHMPGIIYRSWVYSNGSYGELTFLFDVTNPARFIEESNRLISTLRKNKITCVGSVHVNIQATTSQFRRINNNVVGVSSIIMPNGYYRLEFKAGPSFLTAEDFRAKLIGLMMFIKYPHTDHIMRIPKTRIELISTVNYVSRLEALHRLR